MSVLLAALRERQRHALASGALQPIRTRLCEIEDGGIRFATRIADASEVKPRGSSQRGAKRANPFLPYEEALFVADVGDQHVCLLNKFPVLRDHALIVTRTYEDQETPLTRSDFGALWSGLSDLGGIAFYNAGALAGASQLHRHLQVVPTPLGPGPRPTPIDPVVDDARFGTSIGRSDALPFHHAIARLRDLFGPGAPDGTSAAAALYGLYREMARAFGCDRPGRPYNLLVTVDWMLFVPRAREAWEGVSLNALAFAGAILLPNATALERVRAVGPLSLLEATAVAL